MDCFEKEDRTDSMETKKLMDGTVRETRLPMEEEDSWWEKWKEHDQLKEKLRQSLDGLRLLEYWGKPKVPTPDNTQQLEELLNNRDLQRLEELWLEENGNCDAATTSLRSSFLQYASLHDLFHDLLKDTVANHAYLKVIIKRFRCYNDRTGMCMNGPLHNAVEQKDEPMVEWLLGSDRTDVNLRNATQESAITILCEEYDRCMRNDSDSMATRKRMVRLFCLFRVPQNEAMIVMEEHGVAGVHGSTLSDGSDNRDATHGFTLSRIRRLIERLLEAGASFNVCSLYTLQLPFELLLKHCAADEAARAFVVRCVELHKEAGAIAIRQSNEADGLVVGFYKNATNVRVTEELLEIYLRYNDERQFLKHMADFAVSDANVKKVVRLLLHTAIDLGLSGCVRQLMDVCGEVMFRVVQRSPGVRGQPQKSSELVHLVELKDLLKIACLGGDVSVVKLLLSRMTDQVVLNEEPLLALTLTEAYNRWIGPTKRQALLACAEFLTTRDTIDISKKDFYDNTPLHLALKYGFEKVANMLLNQRHAFIWVCNDDNLTPLDYGSYEFWKAYFDRCIKLDVERSTQDRNVLSFNLHCLNQPVPAKGDASWRPLRSGWKLLQKVSAYDTPHKRIWTVTEMTAVRKIAQSKELKRLLIHPVIHTFIMVKWMRLSHWIYLNLALIMVTVILFGAHSVTECSAAGPYWALWVPAFICTAVMFLREVMQMCILGRSYASLENILDLVTVGVMIAVLCSDCSGLLASFVMIGLAMQLTFLLGSLPFNSLSTIMYMFKTVSQNFLKSFLVFLPLIGAFVFAFHLTYNEPDGDAGPAAVATDGNGSTEDSFNNFRTFWNATIKTLVMTTGEFEAAAIDFSGGRFCLFIVFLFFAPIVILNLINGLAVSDIAAIRAESELISVSKKVMLLERYERAFASVQAAWLRSLFPEPFFQRHNCWIDVRMKEMRKIVVHQLQGPAPAGGSRPTPSARRSVPIPLLDTWATTNPVPVSLSEFSFLPGWCWDGTDYYVNLGLFRFSSFMRLDHAILNEALAIIEKQHPDSEGAVRSDMEPRVAGELEAVKESISELKSMVAASQSEIHELRATVRQVPGVLSRCKPSAKRSQTQPGTHQPPRATRKQKAAKKRQLRQELGGEASD